MIVRENFFFYYPINDNEKIKRNARKTKVYIKTVNYNCIYIIQNFTDIDYIFGHLSNQNLAEVCVCQMES